MIKLNNYKLKNKNPTTLIFNAWFICGLVLFSNYISAIEIIVNDTYDKESISRRELRAIFGSRLNRWPFSGENIVVVVLSGQSKLHSEFCKNTLNVFPHQLTAGWDRVTYTGAGLAPIKVKSIKEMIETVGKTSGAIGYIDNIKSLKAIGNETIKVLQINK